MTKIRDFTLTILGIFFYRFFHQSFIYNSTEDIALYQFKKLKKLLIVASLNVPYYKELFEEINFNPSKDFKTLSDLKKIPVLEQDTVKKSPSKFVNLNVKNYVLMKTSGTSGTSKKYTITNKTLEAIVKKTSNSGPLNIFQDYGMNTNNSNTSLITVGSESRVSRVSRPREFKGLTLVFTPEPFPKKTCHNISITKDKQMSCHKVFSTEEDGTNYITSDKLSGGAFGEVYTLSSHPGYILKYITQSMDKNPQEEVNYQKAAAEVGIAPQVLSLIHI